MHHITKKILLKAAVMIMAATCSIQSAQAFSSSHFASQSKLASGRWVKIAIPQTGVYQLTADDLSKMGFSNPDNVRIYGNGGYMMSEQLDASIPDDLNPVPVKRIGNKICFYAKGPVKFWLADPRSSTPHFARTVNTYSSCGYYFLVEEGGSETAVADVDAAASQGTALRDSSLSFFYHEKELTSITSSGKDLLGEDMTSGSLTFDYSLPGFIDGSRVVVTVSAAANTSSSSNVRAWIDADSVPFTNSASKIYVPASNYVYYNQATPSAGMTLCGRNSGKITAKVICSYSGVINTAKLDYAFITYHRRNSILAGTGGQTLMMLNDLTTDNRIDIHSTAPQLTVWNVDNPDSPQSYALTDNNITDSTGTVLGTVKSFTPGFESRTAAFVAFDPSDSLLTVTDWQAIDNQNLHGMEVPDMLIITTNSMLEQAERVANLHRDRDDMTVAVVDHEKIFNEFSSGAADAMGYRLLCKMLYDRNKSKFKYLLLLGGGSFDNRGITRQRGEKLLTYQSDCSNDEDYSYTTDDFFGFLDDNSGYNISADMLRIGVGRFTSADAIEAKADVDKLINYVENPDYGYWRNNTIVSCDEGDNFLHMFQAEGTNNLIDGTMDTGLAVNKVYVPQFTKASEAGVETSRAACPDATKRLRDQFTNGAYFATYIGHAGPTVFTKFAKLWSTSDVKNNSYPRLPIMSIAACDVARYDSEVRGIADMMFHKTDGGAIALLASTRSVYAEGNDALNTAFIKAMFNYRFTSQMPTLGEVYMKSKQSFGTTSNTNKLSFCLLGDPAMRINYPRPLFKITRVNNRAIEDSSTVVVTRGMQELNIEANVLKAGTDEIDTDFNGDATLALYDAKRLHTTVSQRVNRENVTRNVYYPRNLLAEANGRVVNGVFKGKVVVPRFTLAKWEYGQVDVYAHRDNSDEMVNGYYKQLEVRPYNDEMSITDTVPPVIEAMYFNGATLDAEDALVSSASTLHIEVSDDVSINLQDMGVGQSMSLILDGGKQSYPEVKNYVTLGNEGKSVTIDMPFADLEQGRHTARFAVYDAAGNRAEKSIAFTVGKASQVNISAASATVTTEASFDLSHELTTEPTVTFTVVDAIGNIVWQKADAQFPLKWNLCNSAGNRIPAGRYRYYGTYEAGNNYGGTSIGEFVVIEPVAK